MLLIRQMLRGVAELLRLDEIELNDISTAVTEAANNVVAHAYPDALGEIEVELLGLPDELDVLVRDRGVGIGAAAGTEAQALDGGIGIPVIRALSNSVAFTEPFGGGTEVRMRFASPKTAPLVERLEGDGGETAAAAWPGAPAEAVTVTVAPAPLARTVFRRVLAALAARAHFSAARVIETQRLAEALVEQLAGSLQRGRLSSSISVAPREVELIVGPLQAGSPRDGLSSLLERFAAEYDVDRTAAEPVLAVRLVEPGPSPR